VAKTLENFGMDTNQVERLKQLVPNRVERLNWQKKRVIAPGNCGGKSME
jgi:hypothetical protein